MATPEQITRRNPQDAKLNETATAAAHSHRKRKRATSQAQGGGKERWRGSNVAATRALTPSRRATKGRGRGAQGGKQSEGGVLGLGGEPQGCIMGWHGYLSLPWAWGCMYMVCVCAMHECMWHVYGMYGCGSSRLPGCPPRPFLAARLTWLPEKDWSPRRVLYVGCGVWKRLGYPLMGHRFCSLASYEQFFF